MADTSFIKFIMLIIFCHSLLNEKWHGLKFRIKFLLRTSLSPVATVRFYNELSLLQSCNKILMLQPTLPARIHRPYLHKGGCVSLRAQYIVEHYRFIEQLNLNLRLLFLSEKNILLASFKGRNGEEFCIYLSTSGFDREGELMLSLFLKDTPVARLSFSFILSDSEFVAFIGGLQGAPVGAGQEFIRLASKACYGLFPKRVIFEVLRSLARYCGIKKIIAVSENEHVFKQLRYRHQKREQFVALYSEFWESIGGEFDNAFYRLSVSNERKKLSDIMSKKRSEYRKRYELLDYIENQMTLLIHQEGKCQSTFAP